MENKSFNERLLIYKQLSSAGVILDGKQALVCRQVSGVRLRSLLSFS
jgi:hypothetical protein